MSGTDILPGEEEVARPMQYSRASKCATRKVSYHLAYCPSVRSTIFKTLPERVVGRQELASTQKTPGTVRPFTRRGQDVASAGAVLPALVVS